MKTLNEYLDMAKAITKSDYRTAKTIKVTPQAISNARKIGSMDTDNAVEIAKILDINPSDIIAACNVAKHPENEGIWAKWVATFCLTTSALSFSIQEVTGEVTRIVCILC
jgi:hypothetical protein